jgi:hypothetical protein
MKKLFVFGLAALLAVAFAMPAGAFESKFEVVLLYDMAWIDADRDYQQNTLGLAGDDDYRGIQSQVNPFGYVGFVLKDKNMGLTFNMEPRGHNDDDAVGQNQAKIRQFFYWWDVNDWFNLTIGQLASKHSRTAPTDIWSPTIRTATGGSNLNVWGLGFGQVFAQRIPQIQGNFKIHDYALFHIALIDPDRNNIGGIPTGRPNWQIAGLPINAGVVDASEETKIPRIDLTLQIDYGPLMVAPSFLWVKHEFDWDDYSAGYGVLEDSVTAWNLVLPVRVAWQGLTLETELNYGQNWGNSNIFPHGDSLGDVFGLPGAATGIDMPSGGVATTRGAWDTDGTMRDTECWGFFAEVKYKFGIHTPGIFWGWSKFENDEFLAASNDFKNDRNQWVFFWQFAVNPHLTITPYYKTADFGEIEFGDGTKTPDLGKLDIYGVNFMVVF